MVFEKGEGCETSCLDACTKYHMSGVLRSGLIAGEGIIHTSITVFANLPTTRQATPIGSPNIKKPQALSKRIGNQRFPNLTYEICWPNI